MLFLLEMATLNSFIFCKKNTKNEYKEDKGYGFMDFTLDCIQKMTEPAQSEGENDTVETESLDSISTAPKQPPCKGLLGEGSGRPSIQSVLKNS